MAGALPQGPDSSLESYRETVKVMKYRSPSRPVMFRERGLKAIQFADTSAFYKTHNCDDIDRNVNK